MTDLELVDKYCEECRRFVDPFLLREVQSRGLYDIINRLPGDINEAKAVARARLAESGKCFGDPEIDQIANTIQRLEFLRKDLSKMNMTNPTEVIPVLDEMKELSLFVKNYFKTVRIP